MKTFKTLLFSVLISSILFAFNQCSKKSDSPSPGTPTTQNNSNNTSLEISSSSISSSSSSGSYSITITTSGSWSVSSEQSWISVSPASGTGNGLLTITISSNSSSSSRSGAVSIVSGSQTKFIAVNQTGSSGSTTSGSTTAGSTTGTQYGTVTFYKSVSRGPTDVSFRSQYFTLTSSSIYSEDPGCNATGCKTFTSVPYGTYTWSASVYNAAGNTLLYSGSGSVTVSSSCKTVAVTTN